ncbi:probable E3 ubiquitin-protein ligase TRIML1 [Monodelphis domestica]|uniref:probable E3 ubiquitin-protein ligase TRIML1 n=1 Tax=Monodelphis domestica TaxID=13616 RepID=UPI0024E2423A|nr:probable E3 ubiquitin-protein ligase TRIML1 [Monodelphis domestica]
MFFPQDMKGILERNEELQLQDPETVNLTYTTYQMTGLIEILRSYQTGITVDPETDRLHLIVPEHFKSLKYNFDPRNHPDNEERHDYFVTVLGTETFTSGKHYWEVDVEGQTEWVLGICEDSVSKNENLSMSSEDVKAIIGSKVKNQTLFWSSEGCFYWIAANKLGIFLDYDEGNITFYDVNEKIVLISFRDSPFQGPVRPFFSTSLVNKGSSS